MSLNEYVFPEDARTIARDIAKEFRACPSHWTQGVAARSRCGYAAEASSPRAVCWCLKGAIDLRLHDGIPDQFRRQLAVYRAFDLVLGYPLPPAHMKDYAALHFTTWNDQRGRTVEEVIALCDKVASFP